MKNISFCPWVIFYHFAHFSNFPISYLFTCHLVTEIKAVVLYYSLFGDHVAIIYVELLFMKYICATRNS